MVDWTTKRNEKLEVENCSSNDSFNESLNPVYK
jgi:hypothetical protein